MMVLKPVLPFFEGRTRRISYYYYYLFSLSLNKRLTGPLNFKELNYAFVENQNRALLMKSAFLPSGKLVTNQFYFRRTSLHIFFASCMEMDLQSVKDYKLISIQCFQC